jgi:hypothetical protein
VPGARCDGAALGGSVRWMAGAGSNVAGVAAMHGIEVGLFPSVCVSGDSNRHSGYYVGPFQDGYQGHDCVGTLPGGSVQRLGEGLRSHPIQSRAAL